RWRGVDVSQMIDAVGQVENWTVPAEAPSITTTVADAPVLGGVILASGSREVDATSGWTERAFTGVTRNFMATRNAAQASPGSTGTVEFTVSGGEIDYVAWQLALTPDLSAPTLPSVDHAIIGAPQSDGFTVAAKISDATSAR